MPTPPPVPPGSQLRRTLESRSAPVLLSLSRLPRWLPAIVLAVVLLTGLAVGGVVGAGCLLLLGLVLLWLAYLSWPLLSGTARLLRVATIAILAWAAAGSLDWL